MTRGARIAAACGAVLAFAACGEEEQTPVREPEDPMAALLASLPQAAPFALDEATAESFAELSLACVDREYPNKPSDVLNGDQGLRPPREVHPAFFGCFDWHSAVHGHWSMARLLKLFPGMRSAPRIRDALSRHLSPERVAVEVAYFDEENHGIFERPYGWAWLLRLEAELATAEDADLARLAGNLKPLSDRLSAALVKYLDNLSAPIRDGTHQSTAFALTHAHDYSGPAGDTALRAAIERRGRDFFLRDADCPAAYEPSGEDFISPCLVEADLMRRVLPRAEFAAWLDRFLPPPHSPRFAPLLAPVPARDRKDPRIGHLIGLSLQRAAAYAGVASALPEGDPRREVFARLAARHRDGGLAEMRDSGYGGEHWLASFAVYLLTGAGPYAPAPVPAGP